MRIRRLNHSIYQIQYHIIWVIKYRRKIIKDYVKTEIIKSLYKHLKKYPDWYIHEVNTGDDHIHLLMEIPPKYKVSEVIGKLKSYTSVDVRKRFKFIQKIYDDGNMWSVGYFVSTIGLNEKIIRKYIEKQDKIDKGEDVSGEFS
jgi:putative transposase